MASFVSVMMTTAHPRSARKTPRRRRGADLAHRAGAGSRSETREARSAARREAILAAALDEFSSRGFEAARLDDVAKRAGVAKGTIYLYFRDKESLFQELVRAMLTPLVGTIEALGAADVPIGALADSIVELFVREIYETRRKDVIRLMISEGRRFPKLAEFYYREVLSRVIAAVRALLRARRRARGGACGTGRFSANHRRAGPGRHHLERLVRTLRTARRPQNDEDPCRSVVPAEERAMTMRLAVWPVMMLAGLALAGCDKGKEGQLQGWVEAELIFVSPDEQGRVETLKVREGDHVKQGQVLFTVDDDLQKADLVVKKTAMENAQQNYDRARNLLKSAAGTQKTYDDAEAALRQAKANLAWSETRLTRRNAYSPADGTIEQVYYRTGETVPAGQAGGGAVAAAESQIPVFRAGTGAAPHQIWPDCHGLLRRLRPGADRESELHRPQRRIHAAGDLQPR